MSLSRMYKTILSALLALFLAVCCVPVIPAVLHTQQKAYASISTDSIQNIVDAYNLYSGNFWKSTYKNSTDYWGDDCCNEGFTGKSGSDGYCYDFQGYGGQCVGFCAFMSCQLTGLIYTYWDSFELTSTTALQPGDVVYCAASPHAAMVYSGYGTDVTFIECWGSSDSELYVGGFNYYYPTCQSILDKYGSGVVYRYSGSGIQNYGTDFYGYMSVKSSGANLVAYSESGIYSVGSKTQNSFCPEQLWHFVRQTDGSYTIRNEYYAEYLTYEAGSYGYGVSLQASDSDIDQRWYFYRMDSGVGIRPASSGVIWASGMSINKTNKTYTKKAPASPTISVSASSGQVKVSWARSACTGTFDTRYYEVKVYSGTSASGSVVYSNVLDATSTSMSLSLSSGEYIVKVRAINSRYSSLSTTASSTFAVSSSGSIVKPITIGKTLTTTYPYTKASSQTVTNTGSGAGGTCVMVASSDGHAATLYPIPGNTAAFKVGSYNGFALKSFYVTYTDKASGNHVVLKKDSGITRVGSYKASGTVYEFQVPNATDVTIHVAWAQAATCSVFRLYNADANLHHYTISEPEKNALIKAGWSYEGAAFKVATYQSMFATPVYRLYNPSDSNHHWTVSKAERDDLIESGWSDEGVAWYAASTKTTKWKTPVYRLYNASTREHLYTTSYNEYLSAIKSGWKGEKIAWYGL